jgi:hypothetical protein
VLRPTTSNRFPAAIPAIFQIRFPLCPLLKKPIVFQPFSPEKAIEVEEMITFSVDRR